MSVFTFLTVKFKRYVNNRSTSEVMGILMMEQCGIMCLFPSVPGDLGKAVKGNSCDVRWQDCSQNSSYSYFIIHPPIL